MAVERPIGASNTQLWAKSRLAVGRNRDAAERRPRVEMFEAGFPGLCRNTRPLLAVVFERMVRLTAERPRLGDLAYTEIPMFKRI